MSEYRVDKLPGSWWVAGPDNRTLAMCPTKPDAERIARALAVLDVVEQDEEKARLAQHASDEDVRRADDGGQS